VYMHVMTDTRESLEVRNEIVVIDNDYLEYEFRVRIQ